MKHFISIFGFFCCCAGCNTLTTTPNETGQKQSDSSTDLNNSYNFLSKLLLSADTVLLVSHIGREVTGLFDKKTGGLTELPPLLVDGRINKKIIKESKIAKKEAIDSLISILARQQTPYSGPSKCAFEPHHTIFIISESKTSYIDLCFHCFALDTSKDLEVIDKLGDEEWNRMKNCFKSQGLKYQIE